MNAHVSVSRCSILNVADTAIKISTSNNKGSDGDLPLNSLSRGGGVARPDPVGSVFILLNPSSEIPSS